MFPFFKIVYLCFSGNNCVMSLTNKYNDKWVVMIPDYKSYDQSAISISVNKNTSIYIFLEIKEIFPL